MLETGSTQTRSWHSQFLTADGASSRWPCEKDEGASPTVSPLWHLGVFPRTLSPLGQLLWHSSDADAPTARDLGDVRHSVLESIALSNR